MEINIEDGLYFVLERRSKEHGHKNPEEYINFLLKQIADKISAPAKKQIYTEEDQKKIKQRLQSLGYID